MRVLLVSLRRQLAEVKQGGGVAERGPGLVRLSAWLHAELIRVHPMQDGNGRLARLAQAVLLVGHGLPAPVVWVRGPYLGALNRSLVTGDLDHLTTLTLTGMRSA